ncbi:ExbD/TolR family protein [Tundrisphaera sp. TA3]|uniref:ExbD/TolR family protein n=1 Tax=Tundrisphaera sp. TA3 TaxID=3435775 RepID=UPI003EB745BA
MAATGKEMSGEPDLTPLLDVVFQLITFFMLVINFGNDNYDARIKLPVAGSARPQDDAARAADERLILNIDKDGKLLFNGEALDQDKAVQKIKFEAQIARANLKTLKAKAEPGDGLPTRVVIRADRDTPFSAWYSLITTCQVNGFQKFDLKAMNSP